jgi:hypothetical protein
MGSKIISTGLKWAHVGDNPKNYILVVDQTTWEVIKLVTAPPLTEENQNRVLKALEEKWLEMEKKYPYPQYDIIDARADDLYQLGQIIGVTDRFEGVTDREVIP